MFDNLDKTKNRMVASPIHLSLVLDAALSAVCYEGIDLVYRGFLWMAFMGIPDADALAVKADDVDLCYKKITVGGVSYPIYNESCDTFSALKSLESFSAVGRYNGKIIPHSVKRSENDLLLRSMDGCSTDILSFRAVLVKKFKDDTLPMIDKENYQTESEVEYLRTFKNFEASYNRIRRSGMYYRFYQAKLQNPSLKTPAHFTRRTDYSYNNWLKVFYEE